METSGINLAILNIPLFKLVYLIHDNHTFKEIKLGLTFFKHLIIHMHEITSKSFHFITNERNMKDELTIIRTSLFIHLCMTFSSTRIIILKCGISLLINVKIKRKTIRMTYTFSHG